MNRYTETHKKRMAEALDRARTIFLDSKTQQKITKHAERLRSGRELCKVSGFVCNLHLIAIATNGHDLNGKRYLSQ